MKREVLDLIRKAAETDRNSAVLLDRILRKLPLQGGKPIRVEDSHE